MIDSTSNHIYSMSVARAGLASALVLCGLCATIQPGSAQSFDFNSGNDSGWTHYTLPAIWGATYTFPDDGNGGKAYRIAVPPTDPDPYGLQNARGGSFRADFVYTGRFFLGVDLLAWNSDWRQEAGPLFYFQDVNLGTSDGYTATYSSAYRTMYISQINDEKATTVGQLKDGSVVLDKTHRYRLEVGTHDGSTFLFQMFDLAEPNSPWQSVIASDSAYNAGVCGLFTFQQTYPSATQGADATFDNYMAKVPSAGTMRATVTDLAPPPAGKATAVYPTISATIFDRDTTVDPSSIVLSMDGVWIPNASLTVEPQVHKGANPGSYAQDFPGATASYEVGKLLPWGSKHTNVVAFKENGGGWQTNVWTWTVAYPYLFASNSLPVGSLNVRGFDARMVQSENGGANLANTLQRARQQLAVPPQIPVDRSATSIIQSLGWNENGSTTNVPGLCPGNYINIAVESFAYLELKAGLNQFHIQSDDRVGLYSGSSLWDPNATTIWENTGDTANAYFDIVAESAGLYPVHCIWEETGGGANLNLWSTNAATGASEVLVNDPTDPAGGVKAFYPIICKSSTSVAGPYTVATGAVQVLNTTEVMGADCSSDVVARVVTGGSFTIPASATTQFYRLDSPRNTKITNFRKAGANVVFDYQTY